MWTQSLRTVTNLFLQQVCPLCDRTTPREICPNCWRQLQQCAQHQPATPTADALPVLAWGRYQTQLKQAIAALKYDGHPQIAIPLGRALGDCWQAHPIPSRIKPIVVPIPLHEKKLRDRSFNQAELLADAFCQHTGLKLVRHGLARHRETTPQFGLGLSDREQNLAAAFILGRDFQPHRPAAPVLLLDDIYTTGTTVRTAASVLRRHGISVCGVLAVAQAALDH